MKNQRVVHHISGLPRSGSTLLAGILRQNPSFHAAMTSPVGGIMSRVLMITAEESEFSVFISEQQKRNILNSIFNSFYQEQLEQNKVIFDTNRSWTAKLPLIKELFPDSKVICCVRNVAWIMDSIERLIRRNVFETSKMFNPSEASTVYSRTDSLSQGNRLVGFAYNALKEAFYSEEADRLLLVDYDLLTFDPEQTLKLIYQFIGEKPFNHDFNNLDYSEPEFDQKLNTTGLHTVRKKVENIPRQTILPPDLFQRFSNLSFWLNPEGSKAHVIAMQK